MCFRPEDDNWGAELIGICVDVHIIYCQRVKKSVGLKKERVLERQKCIYPYMSKEFDEDAQ